MALSKLARLANEVVAEQAATAANQLAAMPTFERIADMHFEAYADNLARLIEIDAPIKMLVEKAVAFEAMYGAVPLDILHLFYTLNGHSLNQDILAAKAKGRNLEPSTKH